MLRRKSSKPKKAKSAKPKKEKKAKAKGKAKKAKPAKPKREGVVVKKAEADVYTIMLVISLAAVLVACLLLWFELKSYGTFPQWNA